MFNNRKIRLHRLMKEHQKLGNASRIQEQQIYELIEAKQETERAARLTIDALKIRVETSEELADKLIDERNAAQAAVEEVVNRGAIDGRVALVWSGDISHDWLVEASNIVDDDVRRAAILNTTSDFSRNFNRTIVKAVTAMISGVEK